jgi:hypothetical protein
MKNTRFNRGELILIAGITLVFAALSALGLRAYLEAPVAQVDRARHS